MRAPNKSLENLTSIDTAPKPAVPPPMKFLRPSGRFEVLKPLARSEDLAERRSAAGSRFASPAPSPVAHRLSWYRRSVAFSAGLAVIALIAGILAGIYAPPEPAGGRGDLVMEDRPPEEMPASPNEPDSSDSLPAPSASHAHDKLYAVRSTVRRKLPRPRLLRASYRPRRLARPSHLVMSSFVPTTLVIYIENGEIKTRIEPQLTGAKRKS